MKPQRYRRGITIPKSLPMGKCKGIPLRSCHYGTGDNYMEQTGVIITNQYELLLVSANHSDIGDR